MTSTAIQAAEYPIKSVTVFKSYKAEVVRTFKLSLQKGSNKVDISGLSSKIDTQSVRISGLGDARLLDIVTTIKSASAKDLSPQSSAEVIRNLQEQVATLQAETSIRDRASDILSQYGDTLTAQYTNPVQMGDFLNTFLQRSKTLLQESSDDKEEILKLRREIALQEETALAKKGAAYGHVDAVLFAESKIDIELVLTYIVSDASWRPTYELHATTENGKPSSSVKLHYRARVNQSTGEDWSNTTLTLSTVSSDTIARKIPHLRPVTLYQPPSGFRRKKVKQTNVGPVFLMSNNLGPGTTQTSLFGQSQQQSQQSQQTQSSGFGAYSVPQSTGFGAPSQNLFGAGLFGAGPPATSFGSAPIPPPIPAPALAAPVQEEEFEELIEEPGTDPITVITETPMAISFSVNGESNIPSDGVDHQVSVAVLPFSAKISYIAIPRIDPRVFLQCQVKNTSEYRLLPGPVNVILDDSFVSKTTIEDVNTSDDFECTLGDDTSAKVTYERTSKTVKSDGGTFSEVTNTTTYTTKISIHNKHQFPINDLIVRDVIPTCEDKRVKIVLRKPKDLADAKDGSWVTLSEDGLQVGWEKLVDGKGGEKEGRFEWKWKIGSGSKVHLEAQWEVKAPGEFAWVETP